MTKAPKTTEEWLNMFPEDIRKKAIEAHEKTGWWNERESHSIYDFINNYFIWHNSEEMEYWSDIYFRAYDGEFDKLSDPVVDPITNNEIGKSGSATSKTNVEFNVGLPSSIFTATDTPNDIVLKFNEKNKNIYDFINPSHYKNLSKEVIDMMKDIWGKDDLIKYCEMCSFKYRMRLGLKPDQPIEQDLEKARWYENKAKELRNE